MNHDITHCINDGCARKDTCHRYLAWLDIQNGNYSGMVSLYTAAGDGKGCGMYWEEKGEKNEK